MTMIKQSSKPPRLRAKGAETRHLIPFSVALADELYDNEQTALNDMIRHLFYHLLEFYQCMGTEVFDPDRAATSAKSFLILYSDVGKNTADNLWLLKPKFHMFQEMAEFQSRSGGDPSRFWCYSDESFIGVLSKMAFSAGGKRVASTTPRNLIDQYRGQ